MINDAGKHEVKATLYSVILSRSEFLLPALLIDLRSAIIWPPRGLDFL
jgi:hypothetical protein